MDPATSPVHLGVLASGRGSNFASIQDHIDQGELDARIEVLISDREDARVLERARNRSIPSYHVPHDVDHRKKFEEKAVQLLREYDVDLVILAGFMEVLSPYFLRQFPDRILNIHPSLLPAFKGLNAQKQALEYGVKYSGCTVHVVTEDVDSGPIIAQSVVPVHSDDTVERLSERILEQEHKLFPRAIQKYADEHFRE